ncbi:MAG: ABC transporter substrate-binding protein [Thermodesulfobacteriota bacterium]
MKKITRREFIKKTGIAGVVLATTASAGRAPSFVRNVWGAAKDTLVIGAAENLTSSWDPYSYTILSGLIHERFTFSFLYRMPQTRENPGELQPDLALGHKLIDPYTLEFTLRKGVKFHDGTPFTAKDVEATFKWGTRKETGRGFNPGNVDCKVIDDNTIQFLTKAYGYPANSWILFLSKWPICAAKDIADPKNKLDARPNGTGPFKHLERKEDISYLQAYSGWHHGKPPIDKVNYHIITDVTIREMALRSKEVHITERLESQQVQSLRSNKDIKIIFTSSNENKWMLFRCHKTPFNDWRVRRAFCHAIDRNIILDIMGEAGEPAGCHITKANFGYKEMDNLPEYSPEKCQKLLAEAGYPKGNGLPELNYTSSIGFYPNTKEYGEAITAMAGKEGFKVKLTLFESASWLQRLFDKSADNMVDSGYNVGSPEPTIQIASWFESSTPVCQKTTANNDPKLDRMFVNYRNAFTFEEKLKVLQGQLLPYLAESVPGMPLFRSRLIHAAVKNLENVYIDPMGGYWLDKAHFS